MNALLTSSAQLRTAFHKVSRKNMPARGLETADRTALGTALGLPSLHPQLRTLHWKHTSRRCCSDSASRPTGMTQRTFCSLGPEHARKLLWESEVAKALALHAVHLHRAHHDPPTSCRHPRDSSQASCSSRTVRVVDEDFAQR